MAQVTGGLYLFDSEWEERTNVCLLLVRQAADQISDSGADSLSPHAIVEAFLWVLSVPLRPVHIQPTNRWPGRFFGTETVAIPTAVESLLALRGGRTRSGDHEALATLRGIVGSSARLWAQGDPENPSTRSVFRQLLEVLWSRRLVRRPPGRDYPRGI